MLKYKVLINGEEVERVSIGAKIIEKLEEAMDTATLKLKITDRPNEFQMYDLLQVIIEDEDSEQTIFDFLINGDRVEEGSKYGIYIHNLDFIEYTYKYNNYMVQSLTRTKNIKNNNPAPFVVSDLNEFNRFYWIPPIDVKTSYYANETITFNQVVQGYQSIDVYDGYSSTYERVDTYIQIVGQTSTRQILSNDDATFNLSAGDYELEYGFVASTTENSYDILEGSDQWLYRFNIRVIKREEVSVLDLLNLVRTNVSVGGGIESKLYFDDTRLFDIDPDIQDYLASVEAPQIFIQKATLRQVLNSIFLYVNAISRVKWNDEDIDELTVDWFNQINGSFSMKNIANYTTQQTANELASKGISYSERALPDNRERANLKLASQNQYMTVRSSNIQIVDGKFGIDLNGKAIYEPKKLVVKLYDVKFTALTTTTTREVLLYDELELDLTPRFINENEWAIKDYTTNFPATTLLEMWDENVGLRANKVGNIAWTQGSTYINFSEVYGEVFQQSLIMNVIREGLNEFLTRNAPEPIINVTGAMLFDYSYSVSGYQNGTYTNDIINVSTLDYEYLEFGLEYITQQDTTLEADREDTEVMPYYAEAKMNQNDKVTNVELASRRLYGVVQRSGTPKRTFIKYHTKLEDILPMGLIDSDNNIITQRGIELQNNYLKATYTTTKYHNRSSLFAGLQQDYRAFEIPTTSQVYRRIEAYTDYILISKPTNNISNEKIVTKIYGNDTLELMFGILTNNSTLKSANTKVTHAYVRTDGFLESYPNDGTYDYAISTPVNSFGTKGELTFEFGFMNNLIAGNGIYTVTSNNDDLRYNNAIKYTDSLGRFTELWFQLNTVYDNPSTADNWTDIERLDNYPLVRSDEATFGTTSTIMYQSGSKVFSSGANDNLIITKDSSQSIIIDYKNRFAVLDTLHYIIGQAFYSNNFLVYNDFSDNLYVYVYSASTECSWNEVGSSYTSNQDLTYNPSCTDGGTRTLCIPFEGSYTCQDYEGEVTVSEPTQSTQYYLFDDLRVKSGWTSKVLLENGVNCEWDTTNNTFRFLGSLLTTIESSLNWAIGDDLEELYWACNYNYNGFDVFTSHFKPNLKEIGNKLFPQTLDTNIVIEIINNIYKFNSNQSISNIQSFSKTSKIYYATTVQKGEDYNIEIYNTYKLNSNKSISSISSFSKTSKIYYTTSLETSSFELLPPTLTISSIGETYVGVILKNNNNYAVTGFYGIDDTTPNNTISLSANQQRSFTITGLTSGTNYTLYARVAYNGEYSELVSENFTTAEPPEYGWESGGSSPSGGTTCNDESDLGNVRCDSSVQCVWNTVGGTYTSSTNDTVNPSCTDGGTRTLCVPSGGNWVCQDYEGEETTVYTNCETCVITND